VAGHSHLVFPGPGAPEGPGIDAVAGRLAGKPAVLPGHTGRHVGLIDLCLRQGREGWRVLAHRTEVRPVQPARAPLPLRADPGAAVRRAASAAHRATLAAMRRPLAHTETELCSHFMMLAACPTLTLVARAQADHVAAALAGTPWADLPLLSAVAPFKAGGRGGPRHYIDIPAGPLERRHAAELYGFPNEIRAVAVTGAGLRGWLERSAEWYRQIAPGAQDAPLLDPQFPSFNFDQILGLTWEIDLSAPPGARIGAIRHGGRPVAEGDRFVVATNSYRANGSGGFDSACPMEVVLREPRLVRDVVETWLRTQGRVAPQPERPFRFRPMPGTSVLILSSPEALRREATLTLMGIEPIEGADPQGFARFRLRL
jgi:2',3'-cyclic-nucleotide 2'-phosphodiesterase/3'-nucleotidase